MKKSKKSEVLYTADFHMDKLLTTILKGNLQDAWASFAVNYLKEFHR